MKEFCDMTKKEKKNFLSMDFAERMIRIEQNVSESFHHPVTYDNTNFFKQMTPKQKENFLQYIKSNKRKKVFACFLAIVPIFLIVLLNVRFTGNLVSGILNPEDISTLNIILLALACAVLIILVLYFISRIRKKRHLKQHIKILDKIVTGKHTKRKKHHKSEGI